MNSNQNGGVTFNILLVLLVMVIFVLGYMLVLSLIHISEPTRLL